MVHVRDAKSLHYDLPVAVKNCMEWDSRLFTAIAITSGLFAGVLISLAQTIATVSDTGAAWEAVRFFVYTAINANLVAVGSSMWCIFSLQLVPGLAQKFAATKNGSWPEMATGEVDISDHIRGPAGLESTGEIMVGFGVSEQYSYGVPTWGAFGGFLSGMVFTICTLLTWIWTAQSYKVATAITAASAPGFVVLVYPLVAIFR